MRSAPFRSLEDWKSTLLTLPDSAYLELLRGVFGTIKTPFNKQRLMEDLIAFLSREEIRKRIARYLDETDAKILTAVALLGKPTAQDLEHFFAGEFSYLELHGFLINLEERFILYRFQEEGSRYLALNPLLEGVLSPHLRHEGLLFPWAPEPPKELITNIPDGSGKPRLDDRVLAGLVAFVQEEGDFFKAEGGIRKKVLEQGNRLFPGLNLPLLIRALQCLELLREHQGKDGMVTGLSPDLSKLRAFQELNPQERLEYWAGAIYLNQDDASGTYHREQLRSVAEFIHGLLTFLEPGGSYPRITLQRFAAFLAHTRGKLHPQTAVGSLLIALEMSGLLESSGADRWSLRAANTGKPSKPVLVMDTPFSWVIYPEITLADALSLAFFADFRGIGVTARFELSRQSVVRGFDRGMDAGAILDLLTRLSGNRVASTLEWTLKDWEQRYSEVSLQHGVVLTLSEDRRYLAEAGPLAPLVARTIAPGVYLLSVSEQSQAAEALEKAGVEILAQPHLSKDPAGSWRNSYQLPDAEPWRPAESSGTGASDPEQAEALKEQFRGCVQTMSLSPAERDALNDRIERRLILSESQLSGATLRSEKREARGLDYVGKAVLVKQAIATQSLVEVSLPHHAGESRTIAGFPEALEKWGGESVLLLKPVAQNRVCPLEGVQAEPEVLRLPLGKIGLLRRIKPSFFGA